MKPKDLFILIIKLFGLYGLVITIVTILPTSISYLAYGWDSIELILVTLMGLVVPFVIVYWLIRKAHKLVSWMKLDEGFENNEFNLQFLNADTLIKVACIVIGGIIVIDYLPNLILATIEAFKPKGVYGFEESEKSFYWIVDLIRVFVGLYLFFNFNSIARFILKIGPKGDKPDRDNQNP